MPHPLQDDEDRDIVDPVKCGRCKRIVERSDAILFEQEDRLLPDYWHMCIRCWETYPDEQIEQYEQEFNEGRDDGH